MKPDDLDKAVMDELDKFAGMALDDIVNAQKKAAKSAVRELKQNSPKRSKGTYAKSWKSQTTKSRTGSTTVIYNSRLPGLVHLLEFGHPIVSGGRTTGQAKSFPHVEPAEQNAVSAYEKELTEAIENGH